jgi:hypothetical protein
MVTATAYNGIESLSNLCPHDALGSRHLETGEKENLFQRSVKWKWPRAGNGAIEFECATNR